MNVNSARMLSAIAWLLLLALVACSSEASPVNVERSGDRQGSADAELTLPDLEMIPNLDRALRVVASTGIVGDVVEAIAGEDAEVAVLMAPNQDPHSYQPTAGDLRKAADADVIFVNGWHLEQGLIENLKNAAGDTPIVPASAGIKPRFFSGDTNDEESGNIDPHVWLAPLNVESWVENIASVLSTLDPANSDAYTLRAGGYKLQLRELDAYYRERAGQLDPSARILVTNHDAFGYFADEYGFKVIGTIVPSDSALAEPASQDIASLVEKMGEFSACSVFVERSANQRLASQLSNDLEHCNGVQVVELYSGALGESGSGAETYLDMMRLNIDRIAEALLRAQPAIDSAQEIN